MFNPESQLFNVKIRIKMTMVDYSGEFPNRDHLVSGTAGVNLTINCPSLLL